MKNINNLAKEYKNVEEVKKAIRSVQSKKSRLKKQKNRSDYDSLMTEILKQEQTLKEVRAYFEPKKIEVPNMTKKDIELLNLEQTNKALKSIQSKKCLVQHNTKNIADNVEYNSAVEVEEMLLDHKSNIKPIDEKLVKKSDINNLLDNITNLDKKIDREYIEEQLKNLLNK